MLAELPGTSRFGLGNRDRSSSSSSSRALAMDTHSCRIQGKNSKDSFLQESSMTVDLKIHVTISRKSSSQIHQHTHAVYSSSHVSKYTLAC